MPSGNSGAQKKTPEVVREFKLEYLMGHYGFLAWKQLVLRFIYLAGVAKAMEMMIAPGADAIVDLVTEQIVRSNTTCGQPH